ncbi:MAG: hypothetical protein JW856_04935 [Dehalococcoidales bacterium]|nr:hypothetical protein [Dehalococcoidales bacterium]
MDNQPNYCDFIRGKLIRDGFELSKEQFNGIDATIGIKKKFEWSWLATQLTISVAIGTSKTISKDTIQLFSKMAFKYFLKHKTGPPRGLQSGLVSFAMLASNFVDDGARKWVQQKPQCHFAAFEMPIIYNAVNNELYYYHGTPAWGAMYYPFFKDFIESHFKIVN